MNEIIPCAECGMPCAVGEYHPYAACLMFKACRDSATVKANFEPFLRLRADNARLAAELAEARAENEATTVAKSVIGLIRENTRFVTGVRIAENEIAADLEQLANEVTELQSLRSRLAEAQQAYDNLREHAESQNSQILTLKTEMRNKIGRATVVAKEINDNLSDTIEELKAQLAEAEKLGDPVLLDDGWTRYSRKGFAEMRPYIEGEDLTGISVSEADTPTLGGMIARNPDNHADQWYVAEQWFKDNYIRRQIRFDPTETEEGEG